MTLPLFHVDAFTERPFAGNPATVPWCGPLVCASHYSALSSRASIWQRGCPGGGRPWKGQAQCQLGRWFTFSPGPFIEQVAPRIAGRTPITNDLDRPARGGNVIPAPCRKVLRSLRR